MIIRLIPALALLLLFSACVGGSLTSTPTPTETGPDGVVGPRSGPGPASEANSTVTGLPEDVEPSRLLQTLANLPVSVKVKGIWFNDYARALAIGGAPQPRSLEEFLAMSGPGESNEYINALRGLGCNSELWVRAKQTQDWDATFGFDVFDVDREVTTGRVCQDSLQPVYFEGVFDASTIQGRLLDLGYDEETASGSTYYTIRGDREQPDRSADSTVRAATSSLNRAFVSDGVLITSPATGPLEEILAARGREARSLADDPVISSLAASLGDPLAAAFLTREMVLHPEGQIEPVPAVRRDKPDQWGDLHQWEAVGIGYGITDGQPWWAFSMFYSDPQAPTGDLRELGRRMEVYTPTLPQLLDGQPLGEACAGLQGSRDTDEAGSVLTARCLLRDKSMVGELWALVQTFDLGFLLP